MNHIQAVSHQRRFAGAPCAWIAIDDKPIENWCAEKFDYPDVTVQWLRWGFSESCGLEVGISTRWEMPRKTPLATFDRKQFDDCLRSFGRGTSGQS